MNLSGPRGKAERQSLVTKALALATRPRHIAIILDGNGRWATKNRKPRVMGHRAGSEAVIRTVEFCVDIDVDVVSIYAFSQENWKRSKGEVNDLLNLLRFFFKREFERLNKNNIRIRVSGDKDGFPSRTRKIIGEAEEGTASNTGLVFNVCLNYGSRQEILLATRKVAEDVKSGALDPENISFADFEKHLYTSGLPDPDLLVRTSGEFRISNFLLYQLAYTEIVVRETLWPDFDEREMLECLLEFSGRKRRYGGR